MQSLLFGCSLSASCPGEWVDFDTPYDACTTTSHKTGQRMKLVFSDEFESDGRMFRDGEDARWTALDHAPYTNHQVNYYNSSMAQTRSGKLQLHFSSDDATYTAGDGSVQHRHFQSAMLQTWNKFCMSSGVVEISALLPGRHDQAGLWPAFWMFGNLGRATLPASTDGLWPWTYEACASSNISSPAAAAEDACVANSCTLQRISACDANPGFGLHPYQGRGAPELDVIEVMPGSGTSAYEGDSKYTDCKAATPAERAAASYSRPLMSTSIIMAPGIPTDADQRPTTGCLADAASEWYPQLSHHHGAFYGDSPPAEGLTVTANYEYYGDEFGSKQFWGGGDSRSYSARLQTDAFSANTGLGETHFNSQHVYRLEWRGGGSGFARWSLDGATLFEVSQRTLEQRRDISFGGRAAGGVGPRTLPTEPMVRSTQY